MPTFYFTCYICLENDIQLILSRNISSLLNDENNLLINLSIGLVLKILEKYNIWCWISFEWYVHQPNAVKRKERHSQNQHPHAFVIK